MQSILQPHEYKSPGAAGSQTALAHESHASLRESLSITSPTPAAIHPRKLSNDLPMDLQIGLRSTCAGITAQRRRKQLRPQKHVSHSNPNLFNGAATSDSNSYHDDMTMELSTASMLRSPKGQDETSMDGWGGHSTLGRERVGGVGQHSLTSIKSPKTANIALVPSTNSKTTSSNPEAVLNGEISPFIKSYLMEFGQK